MNMPKIAALASVLVPHLAVIFSILWHRDSPVEAWHIALFVVSAVATELGLTAGYHRLFSHRSYDARPWVAEVLGALGSMASQGPLLFWVDIHRRHHKHSDEPRDPHSPNAPFRGIRGFAHSHVLWLLDAAGHSASGYTKDLYRNRTALRVHRNYGVWVLLGLLLPAAAGGMLTSNWQGLVSGLLWGGLLRMAWVHHVTWCVNSVCHFVGKRPHASGDESRNNLPIALLTLGEGWHNNHHAFPTSPQHGHGAWQPDITYWFIHLLCLLKLASLKTTGRSRQHSS